MAVKCPRCGCDFDVTLFQFGHTVRCDCGQVVRLEAQAVDVWAERLRKRRECSNAEKTKS